METKQNKFKKFIFESSIVDATAYKFTSEIQSLLNLLVFFIIWPAINLLGNSITFYIFIILSLRVGSFWLKSGLGKPLFMSLILITILSAVFAPYADMPRHEGLFSVITICLQWVYWILLSVFFIVHRNAVDYFQVAKWVFYGTIAAAIGFYLVRYKLDTGPLEFKTFLSRNSFVFTLLVSIPVSFYYLKQAVHTSSLPYYLAGFLLVMLLTNGRSGGIIILLEILLICSVLYQSFQQLARILFAVIIVIFFLNETSVFQPVKNNLADKVAAINPRLASLLRGEEGDRDGDLSYDKSWLLRVLMVEKGLEIVAEHPIIGIGPNNFVYYDAALRGQAKLDRLSSSDRGFLNSRSSHNSYIQVLSEYGVFGFFFFILILIIPVFFFIKKFFTAKLQYHDLFAISIIGAAMHFYAINTITGAIAWMFIGLAWVCISFQKSSWFQINS